MSTPAHPADRAAQLARVRNLGTDIGDAFAASLELIEASPDDPTDAGIAEAKISMWVIDSLKMHGRRIDERAWSAAENRARADLVARDWGLALGGHLVLDARSKDPERLTPLILAASSHRRTGEVVLTELFDEARSLNADRLVGGITRRERERVSGTKLRKQAGRARDFMREQRLDEAADSWIALQELDPTDPEYSEGLTIVRSEQGRARESLRELLWTFHLDPSSARVAGRLIEQLTAFDLYPSAVEVSRQYLLSREHIVQEDEAYLAHFARLARVCTTALACIVTETMPGDLDPEGASFVDMMSVDATPWFASQAERAGVFISYRRADGTELAGGLRDGLSSALPSSRVHFDGTSMVAARDFTEQIRAWIDDADVVFALVTPHWSSPEGLARLQNPRDVLRRELEYSYVNWKTVVPVLVGGATMPSPDELPASLRALAETHAVHILSAYSGVGELLAVLVRCARDETRENRLLVDPDAPAECENVVIETAQVRKLIPFDSLSKDQRRSLQGRGVEWPPAVIDGAWHCKWKNSTGGRGNLHFVIGDLPGSQFTGRLEEDRSRHDFDGEWQLVAGATEGLLVGFNLSVLVDGEKRGFFVPLFEKLMEDVYYGELGDGTKWESRNVVPRRDGI